jgi:hypothetical protein
VTLETFENFMTVRTNAFTLPKSRVIIKRSQHPRMRTVTMDCLPSRTALCTDQTMRLYDGCPDQSS